MLTFFFLLLVLLLLLPPPPLLSMSLKSEPARGRFSFRDQLQTTSSSSRNGDCRANETAHAEEADRKSNVRSVVATSRPTEGFKDLFFWTKTDGCQRKFKGTTKQVRRRSNRLYICIQYILILWKIQMASAGNLLRVRTISFSIQSIDELNNEQNKREGDRENRE